MKYTERFVWKDVIKELERFDIHYIGIRTKEMRIKQINRTSFRRRKYIRKNLLKLLIIMEHEGNKKRSLILEEVIRRTANKE